MLARPARQPAPPGTGTSIPGVPAGDLQRAFARASADDGILLGPTTFDWLTEQGHVGLERVAKARRDPALVAPVTSALAALAAIHAALRGDVAVLVASRENLLLPVDLFHAASGTVVAVDGPEHFTSARGTALQRYPSDARLGFDAGAALALCRELGPRTDGLSRGLPAKGFGFGGIARERAYRDALLDLGAPAMGHPPVIRIPAPDDDGAAAYERGRSGLVALREA
jgi:hypothetical protein